MTQRQAYYDAGGTAKTDISADSAAYKMFSHVQVKAFYDSLIEKEACKAVMTRDRAIEILSGIAETKITDVAKFRKVQVGEDDDGNPIHQSVWELKDSEELTDEAAGAIEEIASSPTGFKFKKHSRTQAIKQLADMEGWNSATKHEHSGPDGGPIETTTDIELARKLAFLLTKGDNQSKSAINSLTQAQKTPIIYLKTTTKA